MKLQKFFRVTLPQVQFFLDLAGLVRIFDSFDEMQPLDFEFLLDKFGLLEEILVEISLGEGLALSNIKVVILFNNFIGQGILDGTLLAVWFLPPVEDDDLSEVEFVDKLLLDISDQFLVLIVDQILSVVDNDQTIDIISFLLLPFLLNLVSKLLNLSLKTKSKRQHSFTTLSVVVDSQIDHQTISEQFSIDRVYSYFLY